MIVLLITIFCFATFCTFVALKYGVQSSISASIYVLQGNERWLYSFMILITAFGLAYTSGTLLGMIAGFLLAIDSFAVATSDDKVQDFLHCFGADAGIAFGMAMLIADFHQWWLVLIFGVFILYALPKGEFKRKPFTWLNQFRQYYLRNHTWWIETAAFVTVVIGLMLYV